jgi:hypothetical protein
MNFPTVCVCYQFVFTHHQPTVHELVNKGDARYHGGGGFFIEKMGNHYHYYM